jgi:hypothetical protein
MIVKRTACGVRRSAHIRCTLRRTAKTFWAGAKLCFGVMALVTIALLFISLNRAHPVETSISVLAINLIDALIYQVLSRQAWKRGGHPWQRTNEENRG